MATTARNVMRRLFTNYVMSFMSMDGRSYGKLQFRDSVVCRLVVGKKMLDP